MPAAAMALRVIQPIVVVGREKTTLSRDVTGSELHHPAFLSKTSRLRMV